MEIRFSGILDEPLIAQAVKLANQPTRVQAVLRYLLLLVIVGVLGFVIYGTLTEPNPQLISWVRVALWLGLLVYFFYQPTLSQRRITQKIWQSIQAQPRMEGTVTPAGVTFTFGEDIQDLPWERFFRIRKSEDMTILLAKNGILSMFPRRFFPNSAEWSQVHQLIDQHVKAS